MQNTMNGTIVVALCNANYKWRGTSWRHGLVIIVSSRQRK